MYVLLLVAVFLFGGVLLEGLSALAQQATMMIIKNIVAIIVPGMVKCMRFCIFKHYFFPCMQSVGAEFSAGIDLNPEKFLVVL